MLQMIIDLQIEAVACSNCGERRLKEIQLEEKDDLTLAFKADGAYFFI